MYQLLECCHSEDLCVNYYDLEEFYNCFYEGFGIRYKSLSLIGEVLE